MFFSKFYIVLIKKMLLPIVILAKIWYHIEWNITRIGGIRYMSNKKRTTETSYATLSGFRRSIPIILVALAVFSGLCFITQKTGLLGRLISNGLLGLFSIGGYFIPFILLIHAFFYPSDYKKKRTVSRIVFSVITVCMISMLTHAITYSSEALVFAPKDFYLDGIKNKGGGFIGGILAFCLDKILGPVGIIIIPILIFALYITYFLMSGKSAFSKVLLNVLNSISDFFTKKEGRKKEKSEKQIPKNEEEKKLTKRKIRELESVQRELTDDDFFDVDNGLSSLKISELGIDETKAADDPSRAPILQKKVHHKNEFEDNEAKNKESIFDYDIPHDDDFEVDQSEHIVQDETKEDIIYEKTSISQTDDSADSVFTSDFDPFKFKLNQDLATKPSSYRSTKSYQEPEGITELSEPISNITEADIEMARRRADFEMKKKAAFEAREAYSAATVEVEINTPKEQTSFEQKTTEPTIGQTTAVPTMEQTVAKPTTEQAFEPYVSEPVSCLAFEEAAVDKPLTESCEPEEIFAEIEKQTKTEFDFSDFDDKSFDEIPTVEYSEPQQEESLKISRSMLDPLPPNDFDFEEDEPDEEFNGYAEAQEVDAEDSSLFEKEIPEEEQNEDVKEYRRMFSFFENEENDTGSQEEDSELEVKNQDIEEKRDDALTNSQPSDLIFKKSDTPTPQKNNTKPTSSSPDYSGYKYPPLDLLAKGGPEIDMGDQDEINQNAENLVNTLQQFGVRVSVKGVDRGPRITRYEIVPAMGVKVQSVMNLFNDIVLNLGAEGVRMEAPIPGKKAIGVEIPNKKPATVFLGDLVNSTDFSSSSSKTLACLGKDVTGNPVFEDIAKMPHVLVAGATGMGKSVCINSILISILYKARPDEVKFIMIDPKKVEFNGYNGIPHLLVPVVTDVKQAAGALMWAVEQMEKRYDLMEKHEVRKIDAYNEKMRENPELGEPLPKIIIVIDELNDIMIQVRKPAEDLIMSIAQKARAAGIHLIIGTQRPSVNVVTGTIKANIPSRISCKVASFQDSKTILEQSGAEKLLNNGDMLYITSGTPKPIRVQGAFVSDGEVAAIMKYLKSQAKGDIYDAQALEDINRAAKKCSKGGASEDFDDDDDSSESTGYLNDQQFLDAVDLAVKSGKISTSLIQRKISVGYGKAAKFIDIMEEMGLVSEPNGQRPRDVLVSKDEWHEMLARRSFD